VEFVEAAEFVVGPCETDDVKAPQRNPRPGILQKIAVIGIETERGLSASAMRAATGLV
jgi:hypothetical protein